MSAPYTDPYKNYTKKIVDFLNDSGFPNTRDLIRKLGDANPEELEWLTHALPIGNTAKTGSPLSKTEYENTRRAFTKMHTENALAEERVRKAVERHGTEAVKRAGWNARIRQYASKFRQYEDVLSNPDMGNIHPMTSQNKPHGMYEKAAAKLNTVSTAAHTIGKLINTTRYEKKMINEARKSLPQGFVESATHLQGVAKSQTEYLKKISGLVESRAKATPIIPAGIIRKQRAKESSERAMHTVTTMAVVKEAETAAILSAMQREMGSITHKTRAKNRQPFGNLGNINGASLAAVLPMPRPSKPYTQKLIRKPSTVSGGFSGTMGSSQLNAIIKAYNKPAKPSSPAPITPVKSFKPSLLSRAKSFVKSNAIDIGALGIGAAGLGYIGSMVGSIPMFARGGAPGMGAQVRTFYNRDVRHLAREQMNRMMMDKNDPYQISGYGDAAQQFQGDPRGLDLTGMSGWFDQWYHPDRYGGFVKGGPMAKWSTEDKTGGWGSHKYDNILEMMSPSDFMKETGKIFDSRIANRGGPDKNDISMIQDALGDVPITGENSARAFVKLAGGPQLEKIKKALQDPNNTFSPLHLEYNKDGSIYDYQEGRHRSIAAEELGIEKIPVWKHTKKFAGGGDPSRIAADSQIYRKSLELNRSKFMEIFRGGTGSGKGQYFADNIELARKYATGEGKGLYKVKLPLDRLNELDSWRVATTIPGHSGVLKVPEDVAKMIEPVALESSKLSFSAPRRQPRRFDIPDIRAIPAHALGGPSIQKLRDMIWGGKPTNPSVSIKGQQISGLPETKKYRALVKSAVSPFYKHLKQFTGHNVDIGFNDIEGAFSKERGLVLGKFNKETGIHINLANIKKYSKALGNPKGEEEDFIKEIIGHEYIHSNKKINDQLSILHAANMIPKAPAFDKLSNSNRFKNPQRWSKEFNAAFGANFDPDFMKHVVSNIGYFRRRGYFEETGGKISQSQLKQLISLTRAWRQPFGYAKGGSPVSLSALSQGDYFKTITGLIRNRTFKGLSDIPGSIYDQLTSRPTFRYDRLFGKSEDYLKQWNTHESEFESWESEMDASIPKKFDKQTNYESWSGTSDPSLQNVFSSKNSGWHFFDVNNFQHGKDADIHKGYVTLPLYSKGKTAANIMNKQLLGRILRNLKVNGYSGSFKIPRQGKRLFSSFDNMVFHAATPEMRDRGYEIIKKVLESEGITGQYNFGIDKNGMSHTEVLENAIFKEFSDAQLKKFARGGSPGNLIRVSDEELGLTKSEVGKMGGIGMLESIRQAANSGKPIDSLLGGFAKGGAYEFEGAGSPVSDKILFDTTMGTNSTSDDVAYIMSYKMRKALEGAGKVNVSRCIGGNVKRFYEGGIPGFARGTSRYDFGLSGLRKHRQTGLGANSRYGRFPVRPDLVSPLFQRELMRNLNALPAVPEGADPNANMGFYEPTRYMRDVMGMDVRDAYNMERAMRQGRKLRNITQNKIRTLNPYEQDKKGVEKIPDFLRSDISEGFKQDPHALIRRFQAAQNKTNYPSWLGRYGNEKDTRVDNTDPMDIVTRSMHSMNVAVKRVTSDLTNMDRASMRIVKKAMGSPMGFANVVNPAMALPGDRRAWGSPDAGNYPSESMLAAKKSTVKIPYEGTSAVPYSGGYNAPTNDPFVRFNQLMEDIKRQQRALLKSQPKVAADLSNLYKFLPDDRRTLLNTREFPNYGLPTEGLTHGVTLPPQPEPLVQQQKRIRKAKRSPFTQAAMNAVQAQPWGGAVQTMDMFMPEDRPLAGLPPGKKGTHPFRLSNWQNQITEIQQSRRAFENIPSNLYKGVLGKYDKKSQFAGQDKFTKLMEPVSGFLNTPQGKIIKDMMEVPQRFVTEDFGTYNERRGQNVPSQILQRFKYIQGALRAGLERPNKGITTYREELSRSYEDVVGPAEDDARIEIAKINMEREQKRADHITRYMKGAMQASHNERMRSLYGSEWRFELNPSVTSPTDNRPGGYTTYSYANRPLYEMGAERAREGYVGGGILGGRVGNLAPLRSLRTVIRGSDLSGSYEKFMTSFLNEQMKEVVSTTGQTTMDISYGQIHPFAATSKVSAEDQINQVRENLTRRQGGIRTAMESFLQNELGDVNASKYLKLEFSDVIDYETEDGLKAARSNITVGFEGMRDEIKKQYGLTDEQITGLMDKFQDTFNRDIRAGGAKQATFTQATKQEKGTGLAGTTPMKINKLFKDLSWKAASVSMSSMGVYFSLMGVFMQLQGALNGVLASLSDLNGMFKNVAYVQAFGGGLDKVNKIMDAAGVNQKDMVEAWKNAQGVQATFALGMTSLASAMFKDREFTDALGDSIRGLFKELSSPGTLETFKDLLKAGAQALPALVDGLKLFVGVLTFLKDKGWLEPLIRLSAQLMVITMLIQPLTSGLSLFLAVGATMAELTAVFGGVAAGLTAIGVASLWLVGIAVALAAAWEVAARAMEFFSGGNMKILKPSDIIGGAYGALTGTKGFVGGGVVPTPAYDMVPGSPDDTIAAVQSGETIIPRGGLKGYYKGTDQTLPSFMGVTNDEIKRSNDNLQFTKTIRTLNEGNVTTRKEYDIFARADDGDGIGVYVRNWVKGFGAGGGKEGEGGPFEVGLIDRLLNALSFTPTPISGVPISVTPTGLPIAATPSPFSVVPGNFPMIPEEEETPTSATPVSATPLATTPTSTTPIAVADPNSVISIIKTVIANISKDISVAFGNFVNKVGDAAEFVHKGILDSFDIIYTTAGKIKDGMGDLAIALTSGNLFETVKNQGSTIIKSAGSAIVSANSNIGSSIGISGLGRGASLQDIYYHHAGYRELQDIKDYGPTGRSNADYATRWREGKYTYAPGPSPIDVKTGQPRFGGNLKQIWTPREVWGSDVPYDYGSTARKMITSGGNPYEVALEIASARGQNAMVGYGGRAFQWGGQKLPAVIEKGLGWLSSKTGLNVGVEAAEAAGKSAAGRRLLLSGLGKTSAVLGTGFTEANMLAGNPLVFAGAHFLEAGQANDEFMAGRSLKDMMSENGKYNTFTGMLTGGFSTAGFAKGMNRWGQVFGKSEEEMRDLMNKNEALFEAGPSVGAMTRTGLRVTDTILGTDFSQTLEDIGDTFKSGNQNLRDAIASTNLKVGLGPLGEVNVSEGIGDLVMGLNDATAQFANLDIGTIFGAGTSLMGLGEAGLETIANAANEIAKNPVSAASLFTTMGAPGLPIPGLSFIGPYLASMLMPQTTNYLANQTYGEGEYDGMGQLQTLVDSQQAMTENMKVMTDVLTTNQEATLASLNNTGLAYAGKFNEGEYTPGFMREPQSVAELNNTISNEVNAQLSQKGNTATPQQMEVIISVSGSDKNEIATEVIRRLQSESIIEGIIRKTYTR